MTLRIRAIRIALLVMLFPVVAGSAAGAILGLLDSSEPSLPELVSQPRPHVCTIPAELMNGRYQRVHLLASSTDIALSRSRSASNATDHGYRSALGEHGMAVSALAGALTGALLGLLGYSWWCSSLGIRSRLSTAMRHGNIHVVYQPLVALASRKMVGVEALARWTHETLGPISPELLFKWAESSGAARKLTRYVAQCALNGVRDRLTGATPFYISINVSPRDIEDPTFCAFLSDTVKALGIDPGRIVLEITESLVFMVEDPKALLSDYQQAGFRILIDDFGAGYANLNNLLHWAVDGIKLDRALVQALNGNSWADAVLDSVLEMARRLNIRLVVEGIETEDQAAYVRQHAPQAIGQGWLFGRPCTADLLPRDPARTD